MVLCGSWDEHIPPGISGQLMECSQQLLEIHSCWCLNSARVVAPSTPLLRILPLGIKSPWPSALFLPMWIWISQLARFYSMGFPVLKVSVSHNFPHHYFQPSLVLYMLRSSWLIELYKYVPSPQLAYTLLWTQISLYWFFFVPHNMSSHT